MDSEENEVVEAKVCSKCGEEKALEEFPLYSQHPRKHRNRCKACERARKKDYYAKNKEKVLARIHNYRANNLELVREQERKRSRSPEACARAREREKHRGPRVLTEEQKERRRAKNRKWYHKNKQRLASSIARSNTLGRFRLYGITEKDYEDLMSAQGGRCAICATPLEHLPNHSVHIDHDHETGKVRGILCRGCNQGIGQLNDSMSLLYAAAAYLESHAENETPPAPQEDGVAAVTTSDGCCCSDAPN